ncbi:hypothetical protein NDU88_010300 [Pleurodeles waltl]|uniref:Uncharacterized protein n=1 Tax=Pleurodeles waltl TaxID=8319 RepID=A0AAV7PVA1_PLEWA|nr:hypothetical protein NDU88_010300 [Pleurodeles waltl]
MMAQSVRPGWREQKRAIGATGKGVLKRQKPFIQTGIRVAEKIQNTARRTEEKVNKRRCTPFIYQIHSPDRRGAQGTRECALE